MGRKCLPVALDVQDINSIEAATDKILAKFGRIDILVNQRRLQRTESCNRHDR